MKGIGILGMWQLQPLSQQQRRRGCCFWLWHLGAQNPARPPAMAYRIAWYRRLQARKRSLEQRQAHVRQAAGAEAQRSAAFVGLMSSHMAPQREAVAGLDEQLQRVSHTCRRMTL